MEIRERAASAGVMDGSGTPLAPQLERRADVVIANGVDDEPLLGTSASLLAHRTEAVLQGLTAVASAVQATELLVAVRSSDVSALRALSRHQRTFPAIQLRPVEDVWPVGEPSLLTLRLTGRQVPASASPETVGVKVLELPTLVALSQASRGLPMLARPLTVNGVVRAPQVCSAPLGMSFGAVIEACGGLTQPDAVLWEGGPLLGRPVSPAQGVGPGTRALLAFPPDHPVVTRRALPLEQAMQRAASSCGGCRQCTDRCPAWLVGGAISPHLLMRGLVHRQDHEPELVLGAGVCVGCRLCESICPVGLSPGRMYGVLRAELMSKGLTQLPTRPAGAPRAEASDRQVERAWLVERLELKRWASPLPFSSGQLKAARVVVGGPDAVAHVVEGQRLTSGQRVAQDEAGRRWFSPAAGQVERLAQGFISLLLDP